MVTQKTVYYFPKFDDAFFFVKEIPETFFIQTVESGTFDYSHCSSLDEAAEEITSEWWEPGYLAADDDGEMYEMPYEEAFEQSMDTLTAYTLDEAVDKAFSNNGSFLDALGYIEMVDIEVIE